ncbi:uncharacterized protein [Dermacentor albipictus]|uniref:uncharacterized protein n=1 Tax=Dermacentor albipictus TaxID=60249 RepID=UPI0038FC4924
MQTRLNGSVLSLRHRHPCNLPAISLSNAWKRFKQNFDLFIVATTTKEQPRAEAAKAALLLSVAGDEALDVFNTFKFEAQESKEDYATIAEKFKSYCSEIFIGFTAWENLIDVAHAQVLAIPAAKVGGTSSPDRSTEDPFHCEATEAFLHASEPCLTEALSFPAAKSTDASTPARFKSSWNGWRHFSGNGSTGAANMLQTHFRFWMQIFIGFAAWANLIDVAHAQVLAIPAAKVGGTSSPDRSTEDPFHCEATEAFLHASEPCLTEALSFPAAKSTDASTPARFKSSWNGWRHFSRNGSTAAANMLQTHFRFWMQVHLVRLYTVVVRPPNNWIPMIRLPARTPPCTGQEGHLYAVGQGPAPRAFRRYMLGV